MIKKILDYYKWLLFEYRPEQPNYPPNYSPRRTTRFQPPRYPPPPPPENFHRISPNKETKTMEHRFEDISQKEAKELLEKEGFTFRATYYLANKPLKNFNGSTPYISINFRTGLIIIQSNIGSIAVKQAETVEEAVQFANSMAELLGGWR